MWPCNLEYIVWLKAEAYASFSLQEERDGTDSMLCKNWERLYDSMRWLGIQSPDQKILSVFLLRFIRLFWFYMV